MTVRTVKSGGGGHEGTHSTIEDALSCAGRGDTIELSPGRYEEVLSITVPDITIRSSKRHNKAIISSRKGEDSLSVITVEASDVTLEDIIVQGSEKQEQDTSPAVQILATDVEVIGCNISGMCIGIKTYEEGTKVTACDVSVEQTAILAEQSAGIQIEKCILKSTNDTGIWFRGASRSSIIDTKVEKCGHTGIWLDSAPVLLRGVTVNESKNRGIVFDWPESTPISSSDYFSLSREGHRLESVKVKKCKDNGVYVLPGVRIICTDCTFSQNGDAGVFFEGADYEEDKDKEETRRERVKACDISVIHESSIQKNTGYGVESEDPGLVQLTGQIKFGGNKKGDMFNVANPAKRARSIATVSEPSVEEDTNSASSTDNRGQGDITSKSSNIKDPVARVTKKSGIDVPENWPDGLYFIGDINVSGFPSIDKLQEFYHTHSVQVNKKVVIRASSKNRGLGLFAAKKLRKDQVVGYYSGHLRRQQVKHDSEYVAKWRPAGTEVDDEWEVDAEWGGNEMRFANYPDDDEDPNMKANCIRRNNLQVIAFKAVVDIKEGAELLWDYGPDYLEIETDIE